MPDVARAVSGIPRADPGGRVTPRFRHRLIGFRHFCSGSLALASLDRACRNLVPAFPQRSPPRLLPAAACGGWRSAPDHRTRRALLHLSYSCAPQTTHAALVTHDPKPTPDGKSAVGRRPPERGYDTRYESNGCFNRKSICSHTTLARRLRLFAATEGRGQFDPKGTLGTGSAGLAVGGAYLAVAAGVDHLVAEFGVGRQDAPIDRAGGGDDLAVAAR